MWVTTWPETMAGQPTQEGKVQLQDSLIVCVVLIYTQCFTLLVRVLWIFFCHCVTFVLPFTVPPFFRLCNIALAFICLPAAVLRCSIVLHLISSCYCLFKTVVLIILKLLWMPPFWEGKHGVQVEAFSLYYLLHFLSSSSSKGLRIAYMGLAFFVIVLCGLSVRF